MSDLDRWDDVTPNERNALVAERVMGWAKVNSYSGRGFRRTNKNGNFQGMWPERVPDYQGDMKHAWRVVEKMEADGWRWESNWHGLVYTWAFRRRDVRAESRRKTLADAICLAALHAREAAKR